MPALRIVCEPDLVEDAIVSLLLLHQRIGFRHGDAFRALERRILDLDWRGGETRKLFDADGLHLILLPPAGISDLLAEGRALGVI